MTEAPTTFDFPDERPEPYDHAMWMRLVVEARTELAADAGSRPHLDKLYSWVRYAIREVACRFWDGLKLSWRHVTIDDLEGECYPGFLRAVELFDVEKDIKFVTYLGWWIRNGVRNAACRHVPGWKLAARYRSAWRRLAEAERAIDARGLVPTTERIARAAKTTPRRAAARLDEMRFFPMFVRLVPAHDSRAVVPGPADPDDPETTAEERRASRRRRLESIMADWPDRDRKIMLRRLGGETQPEIGRAVGLSKQAVSLVCVRSIKRARDRIEAEDGGGNFKSGT